MSYKELPHSLDSKVPWKGGRVSICMVIVSYFTDEQIEAKKGEGTCPESCGGVVGVQLCIGLLYCVTNYHKLSSLKHQTFIVS